MLIILFLLEMMRRWLKKLRNEMMKKKYEMIDMGLLHCFLGIEAYQEKDGVFIWVCLTYPKKVWRGWLQSYIYSFSCE